jgi:hypothetical protein
LNYTCLQLNRTCLQIELFLFYNYLLVVLFWRRYTQWLDETGRLQADLTVTKLSEEKFMVVATDTMHNHTQSWFVLFHFVVCTKENQIFCFVQGSPGCEERRSQCVCERYNELPLSAQRARAKRQKSAAEDNGNRFDKRGVSFPQGKDVE